jgi:hypothetical protein
VVAARICSSRLNNEDPTRRYGQFQKAGRNETVILGFAAQKYRILIASIFILAVGVIVPQCSLSRAGEQQSVIHQLRIYEIFDSNKQRFMTDFEIMPCVSWPGMTSR